MDSPVKPCYSNMGGFIPSPLGRPSGIRSYGSAVQPKAPARCASETSAICCWINSWTKPQWPGWQLSAWPDGNESSSAELGGDTDLDKHIDKLIKCIITGYSNLDKSSNTMLQMTSPYWPWSGHEPRTLCSVHLCWSSQKCKIGITPRWEWDDWGCYICVGLRWCPQKEFLFAIWVNYWRTHPHFFHVNWKHVPSFSQMDCENL